MRRPGGFTILEVMVSIAILVMLTAALMAFGFGLGERRDRLLREGERGAVLSRVMDRVERAASSSTRAPQSGSSWLEIQGRGVWPEARASGAPAGPVGFTGRLAFGSEAGELVWQERREDGQMVELVVGDVEGMLVDRFEDVATNAGSRPPIRVSLWLAPVGRDAAARPGEQAGRDPLEPGEDSALDAEGSLLDGAMEGLDDELPARAADVVFVVADPVGVGVDR